MKSVSFLIFWLLPLLPTGGHDLSVSLAPGQSFRALSPISAAVIESAADVSLLGDPSKGGLVASFFEEEEEDSLEDHCFASGSWVSPLWGTLGWDALSFSHPQRNLLRSPSSPSPLRC
jgi:hypothetical protein